MLINSVVFVLISINGFCYKICSIHLLSVGSVMFAFVPICRLWHSVLTIRGCHEFRSLTYSCLLVLVFQAWESRFIELFCHPSLRVSYGNFIRSFRIDSGWSTTILWSPLFKAVSQTLINIVFLSTNNWFDFGHRNFVEGVISISLRWHCLISLSPLYRNTMTQLL